MNKLKMFFIMLLLQILFTTQSFSAVSQACLDAIRTNTLNVCTASEQLEYNQQQARQSQSTNSPQVENKTQAQMNQEASKIQNDLKVQLQGKTEISDEARQKLKDELKVTDEIIDEALANDGNIDVSKIQDMVKAREDGSQAVGFFRKAVDKLDNTLLSQISVLVNSVLSVMGSLLLGVATIQLLLAFLPAIRQNSLEPILATLWQNVIRFGFVAYLFTDGVFLGLLLALKKFFLQLGVTFAGTGFNNASDVTTGAVVDYIMGAPFTVLGMAFGENVSFVWRLLFALTGIFLLIVCIKVVADFLVIIVEYDILGGLSAIYLIFLLWEKTMSFGMKAFNIILANGLKITVAVTMIALTVTIATDQNGLIKDGAKPVSVFIYVAIMCLMGYLCSIAPQTAQSLVAGTGGSASGTGFTKAMVNGAKTAGALATGAVLNGFSFSKMAGNFISNAKDKGWGNATKEALGNAKDKAVQKAKDKVSSIGGIKDGIDAFKNTDGSFSEKMANFGKAYKNNSGVIGAKMRKTQAQLKKAEKQAKAMEVGAIAGSIVGTMFGQSRRDRNAQIQEARSSGRMQVDNYKHQMQSLVSRANENGVDITAQMSDKEYEDYLKNTNQTSTVNNSDVVEDLDNGNSSLGANVITDNKGKVIANTREDRQFATMNRDGLYNDDDGMFTQMGDKTTANGMPIFENKKTGKFARPLKNGEKLKEGMKTFSVKNAKGQEMLLVEIADKNGDTSQVKKNARGDLVMPKNVMDFSCRPNVDTSFNNKQSVEPAKNVGFNDNQIQRVQNALSDINTAEAILD